MAEPPPPPQHPGHVAALTEVCKIGLSPEKLAGHLETVALLLDGAAVDPPGSSYDQAQAVLDMVRDHVAQVTVDIDRRQLELLFGMAGGGRGLDFKHRADTANLAYSMHLRGDNAHPISPKEYAARHVPPLLDQVATLIIRDSAPPAQPPQAPPPQAPPPPELRRSWRVRAPLLAVAATAVAAFIAVICVQDEPDPPIVYITRPVDGASVQTSVAVEGTVSGLATGQELCLVVKPDRSPYYPQQHAVEVVDGRWSGPVSLGGTTSRADERFTILAVVVTRAGGDELEDAVRAVSPGMAELPATSAKASIVVGRQA